MAAATGEDLDLHGIPLDAVRGWAAASDAPQVIRRLVLGAPRGLPDKIDRVADLSTVADESVHELLVYGVVERAADPIHLWREIYRVLALGGRVRVNGAYWLSADCWADPTRVRGLSERMFLYLSRAGREQIRQDAVEDDVAADAFEGVELPLVSMIHVGEPEWNGRSDDARAWGTKHYANVVRRLDVTLRKGE